MAKIPAVPFCPVTYRWLLPKAQMASRQDRVKKEGIGEINDFPTEKNLL